MNRYSLYKKGLMALLALALVCTARAQERWSLKRCIDYAIEHNVTIRQTANQAEQSRVEVNTAKWARLPSLNGSAGQNWSWGRSQTAVADEETGEYNTVYVNTNNNTTNFSLSAGIPLFTGMQIPNEYALAKLNLKASLADLAKAKEDIAINIASAYLQVLFNMELHEVAVSQAGLSREQYERISRLAEVGKASPSEVAEAKARVAQDELSVVQADNDYRLAVLDLTQLIELDTPEGFLAELSAIFRITEQNHMFRPREKGEIGLYLEDSWYCLEARPERKKEDPVGCLDVSLLQREVLSPLLGIDDPKTDPRIDFVGGIRGLKELERRCRKDCAAAFSMYPTSMEELFAVADAGSLMPPKSTWFEPKLRSGLLIHEI